MLTERNCIASVCCIGLTLVLIIFFSSRVVSLHLSFFLVDISSQNMYLNSDANPFFVKRKKIDLSFTSYVQTRRLPRMALHRRKSNAI